jgi:Mrp family chromosome partitioning ATPase
MTLIDQAVLKAFSRQDRSSDSQPILNPGVAHPVREGAADGLSSQVVRTDRSTRELFLHAPEIRLRGLHHGPPGSPSAPANNLLISTEPDAVTEEVNEPPHDSADTASLQCDGVPSVELVMNSLLSYELSIQAPQLDSWQMASGPSPGAVDTRVSRPEASERVSIPTGGRNSAAMCFKAAWETDAFRLTDVCRKIRMELSRPIQKAASDLIDDCRGGNRPLICVTGQRRGEGRTTVSMLLAHALAEAGVHVILIGGDPANPDLSERLGVAIEGGWNREMTSMHEIAECCVRSIDDGFCFLPIDPLSSSAEKRSTTASAQLLELLAGHFEAVVVDAGTVNSSCFSWPEELLGAYVVVRDCRQPDNGAMEHLVKQLSAAGPCAIRVVDNFASRQLD